MESKFVLRSVNYHEFRSKQWSEDVKRIHESQISELHVHLLTIFFSGARANKTKDLLIEGLTQKF